MAVSSHTLPLSVHSRGLYRLHRNNGATVVEKHGFRLTESEKHWI